MRLALRINGQLYGKTGSLLPFDRSMYFNTAMFGNSLGGIDNQVDDDLTYLRSVYKDRW